MLASPGSWRRHLGEILDPPLVRSATFLETAKNSISRIVDRDKPQPGSEYRCSVHADASRRYKPVYLGQRHHRGNAGRAQIYHQQHRRRGVHITENTQTSSTWWVQVKFPFHESCSATDCKCSAFYGKKTQLLIWDQTWNFLKTSFKWRVIRLFLVYHWCYTDINLNLTRFILQLYQQDVTSRLTCRESSDLTCSHCWWSSVWWPAPC